LDIWRRRVRGRDRSARSALDHGAPHQAARGTATTLLRDFESHETVQAAAAMLGDMTPAGARETLASMDDSWVHEYDLMLPRGERPFIDPLEAEVTARYLVGLAVVATGARTPIELRLSDPELSIGVGVTAGIVEVAVGSVPAGAPVIEGRLVDFVDRTTGRQGGAVRGDDRALAVIDDFARLLVD
jgi:hypothetical protein